MKIDGTSGLMNSIIFPHNFSGNDNENICGTGKISALLLLVQSVPITTKVLCSNPVHGAVYLMQHYVIKFVSDLRQVVGFLRVLRFPPPIKLALS
jgi:hypothetical protein